MVKGTSLKTSVMTDPGKFSLLIVDDEQALREALIFYFRRKGFQVFSAENGTQAFEIVRSQKIDLVISDIRMPNGDGIGLLENIKSHVHDAPPLIFMTGFAEVSLEECVAKGAKTLLSKPFDRKVLVDLVFETLGLARETQ